MRAWINGVEVFLDRGNLFALTASVNSLTDPSKIKGVTTTTIKVIATPEARRACGWPQLITPMATRVAFRAEATASVLDLEAVVKSMDRNVIELIGIGGNATWFDFAKSLRLRDQTHLGLSPAVTYAIIQNSWNGTGASAHYFPLVDYGSLEGSDGTHNVPMSVFRPAVGVFWLLDELFRHGGYEFYPRTEVVRQIVRQIVLTPGSTRVRRTQGDPATRVVYSEIPSIQYNLTQHGTSSPSELSGSDTTTTFGAAQWDAFNFTYQPVTDGLLWAMFANGYVQIDIPSTSTDFIGRHIRMSLWDFTDGVEVAGVWSGEITQTGALTFGQPIGPKYVLSGHSIGIVFQIDGPVSDYGIEVVGFTCTYAPEADYLAGEQFYYHTALPNLTLADLLLTVVNLNNYVITTEGKRIVVRTWNEYMRTPRAGQPHRDWTQRMDHSNAPLRTRIDIPKRVVFEFTRDGGDREAGRLDRMLGGEGYGNAAVRLDGCWISLPQRKELKADHNPDKAYTETYAVGSACPKGKN